MKTILEGTRRRFQVAAAETGYTDKWQRTQVSFAIVSSSRSQVEQVADSVERFVWSFPEAEGVGAERAWLETD